MVRTTTWALGALTLALAPAAPGAEFFNPCCYTGEVVDARLADLEVLLEDGTSRPIAEVLPGVTADGLRGQPLYTERWRYLGQVGPLAALGETYDANDDGMMDHQELVVLVVVEAARGIGVPARGVAVGGRPARALALPGPEIRQLTGWVTREGKRMDDAAVSLFMDVDALRSRVRGRSGSRS